MARDFATIGRALSAPARAAMLEVLMDGSRRPASELAAVAGVGAPAASEHLGVLADAGLVVCAASGRRRFYRLAGPEVARALEGLGVVAPARPETGWTRTRTANDLARARLCYDHLAGRLGVALFEAMHERGWIADGGGVLTDAGRSGFAALDVDLDPRGSRRPLARPCADWTERRPHLAGVAGRALAEAFVAREWAVRWSSGRGLRVTPAGDAVLAEHWGIRLDG